MSPERVPFLLALMGPTASGKSDLAEALADRTGADLVNADAFQIYRGLDVGTGKPLRKADYRLVDIRDPSERFGVGEYVREAQAVLTEAFAGGRSAILVGGTGFYVRALFEEYADLRESPDPALRSELERRERDEGPATLVEDLTQRAPEVAARIDLMNPVRVRRALERVLGEPSLVPVKLPPFRRVKHAILTTPEELERRIVHRVANMMHNGWIEEVTRLRDGGADRQWPGLRAIGYGAIWDFLEGGASRHATESRIVEETRRYAKRQRTWLRSEPNLGWLGGEDRDRLVEHALHSIGFV
ncbi:MAG: tRNA (adenosine(37)-N6)-dimethylallyltransferase MiaA [Fimbriimonadaceae bacterium]|nr:tRNA (adenosine(37)-N6)-dimethylallyltransferase MiaA [Fimbriimonadaceae bacterium]